MTTNFTRKALTNLRRVIEAVPDHLLHMETVMAKRDCGTVYCAGGWAALDPWFIKHGFVESVSNFDTPSGQAPITARYSSLDGKLVSMGLQFTNAADFFQIPYRDACALFGGDVIARSSNEHPVSKREVLDNIDRMLQGESPLRYRAWAHYEERGPHA